MKLFVDLDGVLADFDLQHQISCGYRSSRQLDNADWHAIAQVPEFYFKMPPMADMWELWGFVLPYRPVVLTGIPSVKHRMVEATANKRSWVDLYLGTGTEMIACQAKDKATYCSPGDILIDDWEKYRDLWVGKGGRFITHTSAKDSIGQLKEMLNAPQER